MLIAWISGSGRIWAHILESKNFLLSYKDGECPFALPSYAVKTLDSSPG